MKSGVYQILNIVTGDRYIGSSIDIRERWNTHLRELKTQIHHSIILQRAWNKYKEIAFIFEVLEPCWPEYLIETEDYYLQKYLPVYNICRESSTSCRGNRVSEVTKQKLRDYAIKNNIRPPISTYEIIRRPVIMLDYKTLEELKQFLSLTDACIYLGRNGTFASTIAACCNGKRKSAFKYKWKFKI